MAENKRIKKTVIIDKDLSTEDKILGKSTEKVKKVIKTYEHPSISYKITNLQVNNKPVIVSGDVVETFIGCKNRQARKELKEGALSVITHDMNGNDMYKIEVVE